MNFLYSNNFIKKNYLYYFILFLYSFCFNFIVANRGISPIDTLVHFDSSNRIILGEIPIRDFWVVHGILVDYLQVFFFKVFGLNWIAYVIHGSVFNLLITILSFKLFIDFKIGNFYAFVIAFCISNLSYSLSGTPFLDFHSTFFSLFSIYLLSYSIKFNKPSYNFFVPFLFCLGFFSKQVPSAYIFLLISILIFFYSLLLNNYKSILFYFFGCVFSLLLIILFLFFSRINLLDFFYQYFLFPTSIAGGRYSDYNLNIKNVFLDYKFIYLLFFPIIFANLIKLKESFNYLKKEDFLLFLINFAFTISLIFHQIYTKNQIFIYFLIPYLGFLLIYYLEKSNLNNKNFYNLIIIILCIFVTLKYCIRYDLKRRFHELEKVDLSKGIDAMNLDKKFSGLKWISPYYSNPEDELKNIKFFLDILKVEENTYKYNRMIISEYSLVSVLLNQKLYSPSRTYDSISYPLINSSYYKIYQNYFINNIKRNNIKVIYIFLINKINDKDLNLIIFDNIRADCFIAKKYKSNIVRLLIKNNCNFEN